MNGCIFAHVFGGHELSLRNKLAEAFFVRKCVARTERLARPAEKRKKKIVSKMHLYQKN